MREAAYLAVFSCGFIEIQIRKRVRFCAAGLEPKMLQQIFADQVGYKLEQFRRSLVRTLKMIPGA